MRPRLKWSGAKFMLVVVVLFVWLGLGRRARKTDGDGVEMEWGVKLPMARRGLK